MTSIEIKVELDKHWVDAILTTAFDGTYGACWYWINEDDDVASVQNVATQHPTDVSQTYWHSERFHLRAEVEGTWRREVRSIVKTTVPGRYSGPAATVDGETLSWACGEVLNKHGHTETARQLREALTTPDELPDLDAEAADVPVQVALFGEIVYG